MWRRGMGKSEGFRAICKRRVQDRCWIILGKWSMGSITCLVPSEKETKNERWRKLLEKGNTVEKARDGLNSTKLSGYVETSHTYQNEIMSKGIDSYCVSSHYLPKTSLSYSPIASRWPLYGRHFLPYCSHTARLSRRVFLLPISRQICHFRESRGSLLFRGALEMSAFNLKLSSTMTPTTCKK